MYARRHFAARLDALLGTFPAVVILGPRQCGKSTLAREFLAARGPSVLFDLERPSHVARLAAAPEEDLGELQERKGIICIDEVQRAPALLPLLRVLLDDRRRKARYLLLGSAAPALIAGASETLAGRIGFLDLTPFVAAETEAGGGRLQGKLWARGGFPRSFLARSDGASLEWREAYVRTLLEQDIPNLGMNLPAATLRRLWTMIAHVHGGQLNASELGAGLGVSSPTVARYLDVLEGTFMIRRLAPYWANVGKRLTKAPKVYVRDTGLLHALLSISSRDALLSHPKVGASWEGWVIEQTVTALGLAGEPVQPYYWRTHGGAEVDLLLEVKGRLIPIEIKLGGAPVRSRGLLECMKDLELSHGFVIHGGEDAYALAPDVRALPAGLLARPDALREELLGRPRTRKLRAPAGRSQ